MKPTASQSFNASQRPQITVRRLEQDIGTNRCQPKKLANKQCTGIGGRYQVAAQGRTGFCRQYRI